MLILNFLKFTMQDIQRQILQLCSDRGSTYDEMLVEELAIDIREVHFHLGELSKDDLISMTSSTYDGNRYEMTPKGYMVLQGKIPLETGNKTAISSQTFNITNNAPTGAQQFGNGNTANINQSIEFDAEIRQMIEELKQAIQTLPVDSQDIATHALSTIEKEAVSSKNQVALKTAFLKLLNVGKDTIGFLNALTALAQRFNIHLF